MAEIEPKTPRPRWKTWLLVAVKLLVVALVLWGVRRTLLSGLEELDQQSWRVQPLWLVASGVFYLLGLLPSGLFWHRLLVAMGSKPTAAQTLRSYYIGHLGKYVPGKAMVIVLRAGLLRRQGVDIVMAGVTIFYETLTTMAVGAFMGAAIVGLWYRENWQLVLLALAMMVVSGLPTLPPVFRWTARLVGVGRKNPALTERLARLDTRTLLSGWLSISVGWVLIGLSLWAALEAIGAANPLDELPRYTASVALATVAGFVSFIPGGFGVREAVLMQVLALGFAQDAAATALVSAVLLRLIWLAAELAVSALLYGFPGRAQVEPGQVA